MSNNLGLIEGMFEHKEETFAVRFNTSTDSRCFTDMDNNILIEFDSSLNVTGKKGVVYGHLSSNRTSSATKEVVWELKDSKGTAILTGNFDTRNKNTSDIHYHWLDIEDSEKAVFKALVDNGTIKL